MRRKAGRWLARLVEHLSPHTRQVQVYMRCQLLPAGKSSQRVHPIEHIHQLVCALVERDVDKRLACSHCTHHHTRDKRAGEGGGDSRDDPRKVGKAWSPAIIYALQPAEVTSDVSVSAFPGRAAARQEISRGRGVRQRDDDRFAQIGAIFYIL